MTDPGAAHETYREFIDGLVGVARSLAARLVREEGDVLANLTGWLDTGGVRWSTGGEPMPAGRDGVLHYGVVGRLEGWPRPD